MRNIYLLSLLSLSLLVSGCSTAQPYQNRTGFFKSYSAFAPVGHKSTLFFHQEEDANLSMYDKLLVSDIQVLPHTLQTSPQDNRLYTQVSAYATSAYIKNIITNSANYKVVDVAQKGALFMQIAISMVEVHPEDESWDQLSALPFTLDASTYAAYSEGSARLLIEARISDAMSGRLLARSMRVVSEEKVSVNNGTHLQFKDLQAALDTWLYEAVIRH